MIYKKTTLKNGLRIITAPMQGTQTASVFIMVGVGSRYESEREAGLTHFIEHMLFKGTEKRPNTLAISEELDSIGGEFNAFTAKDRTAYYAKADSKHIDRVLDVLADMYLNSKLEQVEIDREKGTIVQELNMYEDAPMRSVSDVYDNLMYGKHALGREIIGYKKSINSFKRKNFIDYMNKFYLANDTVVCVAGKFDEKKVLGKIKKYFAVMDGGKKPAVKKVAEKQKKPMIAVKQKKTDQTHFILGVRAYPQEHPDRFALGILATILGGNMSSRLFIEVRERRGLAYSIHTDTDTYVDCGYLATQAGVDHGKLELTIKTILDEYKKIATEKVSEKELRNAKDYIRGKSVMGLEQSDEVAMYCADQEVRKNKIMTPEEYFEKIEKVTADDVLRVAKYIFKNEKLNLAIIGPHRSQKKLENIFILE